MTDLKRCHACGAECRIESFDGGIIDGVVTLYMCANDTGLGGDCPFSIAYFDAEAWNGPRPVAESDAPNLGEEDL